MRQAKKQILHISHKGAEHDESESAVSLATMMGVFGVYE